MGALPFFSCAERRLSRRAAATARRLRDTTATAPRRPRHAEIFPLRRVRTFLSLTTPRFVTFCKCLSLRNRVARGAGMLLQAAATALLLLQKCYIRQR